MIACARDILFWLNTFFWIFEPRPKKLGGGGKRGAKFKCIPFITYPIQDRVVLHIVEAIRNGEDILIRKSRDMGATWICLAVFLWFWLFERDCTFTVLSAKEEMVDKRGNPKTLFSKMLYTIDRLPAWMRPPYVRTAMHLENKWNGSVIDGEATQKNATVSDRRMALLLDEFAKVDNAEPGLGGEILGVTADATDCRVINSTPDGHDTGYYAAHESEIRKEIMHWSDHPLKNPGLYSVDLEGNVTIIDEAWHLRNPGYNFVKERGGWEGLRSPWYDKECQRRRSSPLKIARELDMSFGGSGDPFFHDQIKLLAIETNSVMNPFYSGRAELFLGKPFEDYSQAPMKLWFHPDMQGRPPQDTTYSVAVDISTGTGASDSCISVGDDITRELVCEYVSNRIRPEILADLAVAVCKWFSTPLGEAFLIWDAGGPGASFGDRIIYHHEYCLVYRYKSKSERGANSSNKPGWPWNRELKFSLLSQFRRKIYDGEYISRSVQLFKQCREYVYDGKDGVEHMSEKSTEQKSGKGRQHGDVVISEALLCEAMEHRPPPAPKPFVMPLHCYGRREEEALRALEIEDRKIGSLGWK